MEAKPLCTRQTVSLSQFLRFRLVCMFPAPSICHWVLQLLPSAIWPMLRASHSPNLLLSLLLFLTVPFFSQTDPALSFLSPGLWICCRGLGHWQWEAFSAACNADTPLPPAGNSCEYNLVIHLFFMMVSHFCFLISFVPLTGVLNNTITGMRADELLITASHPASVHLVNHSGVDVLSVVIYSAFLKNVFIHQSWQT